MPGPASLDAPPAQPPAVQAGGPAPMAGVGGMLASKAQAGMDGKGMVVTAWETCKKVMSRISEMSPEMAPFVARAISVMDSGLEKLSQSKPGSPPETQQSAPPPEGNAPGGAGPGGGFPG